MFRTFLICVVLMAVIAAVVAGAVAKAGGTSPAIAATAAKAKARTGAVSAPGPKTPADKGASADKGAPPIEGAPKSGDARHDAAKAGEADSGSSGAVKLSGESVVGDQNAPKSLTLVPWKSAEIGKMPGLSMLLDDSVRPVDRDVFMRELAYYRIRTGAK